MTEEEDSGRGLAGPGKGREKRRRWYFSHYGRLAEAHRRAADRHREKAAEIHPAVARGDVRARNAERERLWFADLREYEAKRIEREEAKARWESVRTDILDRTGGIKPGGEDYRDLPVSLRRARGVPLDEAAEHFGFGGQDEMVREVRATYDRYKSASAGVLTKPKKPAFEKEPRRKLTAQESAERKQRRREIRELRDMLYEGEKELGRGHPALDPIRESLDELKAEDKKAA